MSGARKPAASALGSGGRAARIVEHGAAALLGIQVARSLYARWRRLGGPDRMRLEQLAEDVKRRALDLRGTTDRPTADDELRSANEALAAGIVELAEADPEVTEIEVRDLRQDLALELERLTTGDIKASRVRERDTSGSDVEPRDGATP